MHVGEEWLYNLKSEVEHILHENNSPICFIQ